MLMESSVMRYSLGLLPSGKVRCFCVDDLAENTDVNENSAELADIIPLFLEQKVTEGLFSLAMLKSASYLSPSFHFWYEFASQYMDARCHNIDSIEGDTLLPISPLETHSAQQILLGAPPMKGSEYLSVDVLQQHWLMLDQWLREVVTQDYKNFSDFLEVRAPQWHQTGRVCFHLAENKNDIDYPFAFMSTYTTAYYDKKRPHLPLAKALQEYAGSKNKTQLIRLLSPIEKAAKSSQLVKALVDSGDIYHPLAWDSQEAYQFLSEVPLFEQSGIVIRLPDWWKKRPRPKVNATLSGGIANGINLDALIQFDVQVSLGEQKLTENEWQDLLASENGLVLFKGQWVEVDKEKLEQAMQQMKLLEQQANDGNLSFTEGMRLLAGASSDLSKVDKEQESIEWAFIQADEKLSKILENIRQPENLQSVLPKRLLKAKLRPYQEVGVNWLWYLNQLGIGACLADDMGLGKTIQIISLLLIIKKHQPNSPVLLVLPTSLLGNWKKELETFAPSLKSLFAHPSLTKKAQLKALYQPGNTPNVDLVVTTYGMLLRQDWFQQQEWRLIVLDEAQAIKNPGSQQTKLIKKLKAQSRIILTGTPVENRLSDLWSLFDFVNPGLLGTASRFKSFTKSLKERETEQYAPLRNLVKPYILRRMKTDKNIISDLPDKTEVYAYCGLVKEQAALYQNTVLELKKALQAEDGIKRRGLVLSYITRFKQICNHPEHYLSNSHLSDSHLSNDSVSRRYSEEKSGKFSRLAEICESICARQEKVLIFTQYREMCQPLADYLSLYFDQPGLVLHGGVSAKKRQQMVEQFQTEEGPPFFVLSIKAGGTGLTLTAASHVIHFDRWWNPAIENQATDRAFRIGQKKNVMVHKMVCLGTIEEKIDAIISEKSAMVNEILQEESEIKLTELSDKELLNLVSLDLEKATL